MFSLTIVFGPGPMIWTLMFRERDRAMEIVTKHTSNKNVEVLAGVDDFGQEFCVKESQLHGFMLEDLEQSKLAHIERALHQARTKVKADEFARADPVLRSAAVQQGGAILQPAMPGMPFQNGRMPS
jgi:hypothetical protein